MDQKEKIALVVAVATVATLLVTMLAWLVPRERVLSLFSHSDPPAISPPAIVPPSPKQHPKVGNGDSSQPTRRQPTKAPSRQEAVKPQFPLEFTLADAEQKVLLGGQASLGIDFHVVDGIDMGTLTINASGSPPAIHS